jgi:hypothetical protein
MKQIVPGTLVTISNSRTLWTEQVNHGGKNEIARFAQDEEVFLVLEMIPLPSGNIDLRLLASFDAIVCWRVLLGPPLGDNNIKAIE